MKEEVATHPNENVWHLGPSEEQSSSQFFRRFVSVLRNVFSKGIIAPRAMRTKQSDGIGHKFSTYFDYQDLIDKNSLN